MLTVISLGAGVQSTTMALMAAHGELTPMPDCAIFADTQWEPKAIYEHLKWLRSWGVLPFPVWVVSAGDIRNDLLNRTRPRQSLGWFVTVPFFLKYANGDEGIGRRQCTGNYKIEPIDKKLRELLGKEPRDRIAPGSVEKWIGISMDEATRMKPSPNKWAVNRWPLIEKRMSRRDCLKWLAEQGYSTPPKSSCIGCPYHSNSAWREMRDKRPEEWADAVAIDKAIRDPIDVDKGLRKRKGQQFMHPKRVPLDEVDLSTAEEWGQLDLFNNECEGLCGV
jgi:hypothetical protein